MINGRWRRMNKHRKRVFAAALAVAVAGTSFNVASYAVVADSSKDGRVIKSFEALEEDVADQYLPVGSFESEIVFPEELKVRIYSSEDEPENPKEPEDPTKPGNPAGPEIPAEPETPGTPETPEDPGEPVSENEGGTGNSEGGEGIQTEGELSAVLENIFGVRTVYAAEEGSETGEGAPETEGDSGDQVSENSPEPEGEEPAGDEGADDGDTEPGINGESETGSGIDGEASTEPEASGEGSEAETPDEETEPSVTGSEEEKILTNVKWKLVRDLSAYSRFEALLEGDVFVYEPDISRYPLTSEAELPQIKVTITARYESLSENAGDEVIPENGADDLEGYPEFSRMMIVGGVRVSVEAPEGVFPEDAQISVKRIDDEAALGAIKTSVGGLNAAAFDITLKDLSGNEIQPRTEYGLPVVTFENVNILKEGGEGSTVSVYHFEDGLSGPEKLSAKVDRESGSAVVEAGHFSPFAIVLEGEAEEPAGVSAGEIRSLSDNKAKIILDPEQFIVKEVSENKPATPPVRITWTDGEEEVLVEGEDYTLEYLDNTKVGTGKAVVTGIGNYEGRVTKLFYISTSDFMPTVLFRGENETVAAEKPKDWYRMGVRFSGRSQGGVSYKAKVAEGDYGDESGVFDEEGKGVTAPVFLSSNGGEVYFLPQSLNIDHTSPTGTIKVKDTVYDGLNNDGKIAHYVNKAGLVSASGNDITSGVESLGLCVTEATKVKTLEVLQKMDEGEWQPCAPDSPLPLIENRNNFVYLRVKDAAGNTGFASARGICFDTVAPVIGKVEAANVNGKISAKFTASDSLSGVEGYYVLVKDTGAAAPAAEAILSGGVSSNEAVFDAGEYKNGKTLYCVVTDRAGNVSGIRSVRLGDSAGSPTGTISIMGKTWNSLQSQAKTVAYTREKQVITITGADKTYKIAKIEYLVTRKFYKTGSELAALSSNVWKTYINEQKPEIEHNVLNYVYARITSNGGAVRYISSEGICHDRIKPVMDRVSASNPKDKSVKVSITGKDELSGIECYYALVKKINESAPDAKGVQDSGTKSEKNSFELTGLSAATEYKVYGIIQDKAGNISEVKSEAFATKKAASSNSASKKNSKADASKKDQKDGKDGKKDSKDKKTASGNGAGGGTGSGNAASDNAASDNAASKKPYIEDASSGISTGVQLTSGWDRIEGESVKAPEPSEISIRMNEETLVPADMLSQIAKRNVTVHFEMENDLVWTVNGLSFTTDQQKDIDLSVKMDTRNIPANLVEDLAGDFPQKTLSLAHDGDFGFKAVLTIPLGDENVGMYANLFYYNEPGESLDYVDTKPVKNDRSAEFDFTHASDYLIILTAEPYDELVANGLQEGGELPPGDEKVIRPRMDLEGFFAWNSKYLWVLIVTIMSLVLCGFVLYVPGDKKKTVEG